MIRPQDIPEEEFGTPPDLELEIEVLFDKAITHARTTKTWPAHVGRPRQVVDRNAFIAVAHRYRSAGWDVTIDLPNSAVLATIKRR